MSLVENHPPSDDSQPNAADHPVRLIADSTLLLQGEYQQVGFDLVITHPGGEQMVIADYFALNPPPNLMLTSGIGLTPEMVRELLHQPFADLMFAGPATESGAATE